MLGSLILYLKGMRIMMFQLSGFYCSLLQKPYQLEQGSDVDSHYECILWVSIETSSFIFGKSLLTWL